METRVLMSSPPLQVAVGVVKKVELARAFLGLAQDAARSQNDFNLYVATNHLQDATEIFLFAVAEHLGVSLREKAGFDGYFDQINAKVPKELPFRPRLNALNKTRVSSKHFGVQPERKEVLAFAVVVSEFFEEVSRSVIGVDFGRISLVHLIDKENIRQALKAATDAFVEGRYGDSLVETRKAFYHEFETSYDVSSFQDKETPTWTRWFCFAPAHAQSLDYIEKNVLEPTDFIVLDHSQIDADLSKKGINHTTFWNVWRLTPALFLDTVSGEWIVKNERRVFDEEGIRERSEYVLHAVTDLCLSAQRNREATKSGPYRSWKLKPRRAGVPLYNKADSQSPSQNLPDVNEVAGAFWVKGFDGLIYWSVVLTKPYLSGFVANDDVLVVDE